LLYNVFAADALSPGATATAALWNRRPSTCYPHSVTQSIVQFRIPRSALAAAAATRAGSEVLVNTMTRMTIRAQR
jgi:hypothetical protein